MMNELSHQFSELCSKVDISSAEISQLWAELDLKYSEVHRHYHTLKHIEDLCQKLQEYLRLSECKSSEDVDAIQWAIFYHDIIYDPTSSHNEEDSAALFVTRLSAHIPTSLVSQVERYILATKSHNVDEDEDDALKLFMDLDLSILAASEPDYAAYARAIRLEYIHFSDEAYQSGRIRVLQHFLGHNNIFRSTAFRNNGAEESARRNIEWELSELAAQPLSKVIFA